MPFGAGGLSFNSAVPGPIGGTTSNTGQFTQIAVGASVPTLPGTVGDAVFGGSIALGGNTAPATAGDLYVGRASASATANIIMGSAANTTISTNVDAASNEIIIIQAAGGNVQAGNVYLRLRSGLSFSNLPAASSYEGALASIVDSTTVTWGATITGGGTHHVLAYSDGTNWTVAAI